MEVFVFICAGCGDGIVIDAVESPTDLGQSAGERA